MLTVPRYELVCISLHTVNNGSRESRQRKSTCSSTTVCKRNHQPIPPQFPRILLTRRRVAVTIKQLGLNSTVAHSSRGDIFMMSLVARLYSSISTVIALLVAALASSAAHGQTDYFWNPPTGNTGSWDTTNTTWSTVAAGP